MARRTATTRFLSRPWLVALGELSFALYLLHGPMFKLTLELTGAAGVSAEARPYVEMLVAMGCLGLSWIMHRYVEEPARIALSPPKREAPHVLQRA